MEHVIKYQHTKVLYEFPHFLIFHCRLILYKPVKQWPYEAETNLSHKLNVTKEVCSICSTKIKLAFSAATDLSFCQNGSVKCKLAISNSLNKKSTMGVNKQQSCNNVQTYAACVMAPHHESIYEG